MSDEPNNLTKKISIWVGIIVGIVGVMTAILGNNGLLGGYFIEQDKKVAAQTDTLNSQLEEFLLPAKTTLENNGALYAQLTKHPFLENGWGVQEAYHAKAMRDGSEPHEQMKKLIDRLVSNNETILKNMDGYRNSIRTDFLREEERLFREHAVRYNARWEATKDAAIKQVETVTNEPTFPPRFGDALQQEIEVVKSELADLKEQ